MKFALITLGLASFAFGGIITTDNSNSNLKTLSVVQGTRIGVTTGSSTAQDGSLVRPTFNQNGTSTDGNIRRDPNGQQGQPKGERKQLTEAEKAEFEAKRAEFEAKRAQDGSAPAPRGERKELTEEEKADLDAKRAAWSKTEEGQAFEKKFEEWRNNQGQKGGNVTHQSQPLIKATDSTTIKK